jgi:hypothetical protein
VQCIFCTVYCVLNSGHCLLFTQYCILCSVLYFIGQYVATSQTSRVQVSRMLLLGDQAGPSGVSGRVAVVSSQRGPGGDVVSGRGGLGEAR